MSPGGSTRATILAEIERIGLVAVIRSNSADDTVETCRTLVYAGVTVCEITMTVPGAIEAIGVASHELGGVGVVGVGTVLDAETAEAAIQAGAEFVVSPILDHSVVECAHSLDKPAIPGALSPNEIVAAWKAGADAVKVFPAGYFGPQYLRDLHAPLPDIRLIPTGGVDLDTTPEWIRAGAVAVGVGSALVRQDLIAAGDWRRLSDLAARYVAAVADARDPMAAIRHRDSRDSVTPEGAE